jgi:hypothetical protein
VPVVGLDDLDIVIVSQGARGDLEELETEVHPDAHVRGHDDGTLRGRLGHRRPILLGEAGGPDHHAPAGGTAKGEVLEGCLRRREIDEDIEALVSLLLSGVVDLPRHRDTDRLPARHDTGVAPKMRGSLRFEGRGDGEIGALPA